VKVLQVSTIGFANPLYYRSHELTLSKSLVELGHEVTLFTADRHPKWQMLDDRRTKQSVETIEGVTIRRFTSGPELGTVPLMPTLLREMLKFDWDILHAHTILAPASFYSAIATGLKKRPLVVTQHDYKYGNVHGVKLFIHKFNNTTIGRVTMHRACAVIGLTSHAAKFVQTFGAAKAKTMVIPNSVDTTQFRPNQGNLLEEKWGLKSPIMLFVGRMTKDKGVDILFRAFRRLAMVRPAAKLVLVGRGPHESSLREMQVQLGIKNVYFLGRVPHEDMPRIYPGADLLVLPSFYEPFGNVVLEAMASGLPVVGSGIGGMAETIEHGVTGYHVTPGNSAELSDYLCRLLMDSDLRSKMSRAARQTAVRKFDDLVIARAIQEIYQKCLSS
jgi:glycosyltransferase involved in cell wall biosynthesis